MNDINFNFLSDEVNSKLEEAIKYLYFFPDFKIILKEFILFIIKKKWRRNWHKQRIKKILKI